MRDSCGKCRSDKIIPQAKIIDRGDLNGTHDLTVSVDENPEAFVFKKRIYSRVFAKVCGECGFIEFYADNPQPLYSAFQHQEPRQKLKLVK